MRLQFTADRTTACGRDQRLMSRALPRKVLAVGDMCSAETPLTRSFASSSLSCCRACRRLVLSAIRTGRSIQFFRTAS